MDSRKGAKIAEEESVGHGIIRAVKGLRPSAGRMLPVLHALHGVILPPFFLWLYFTMKAMKSMKGRGRG
jgi:succinate dehydrogenase/fumarate reductase cytochrome b subunit